MTVRHKSGHLFTLSDVYEPHSEYYKHLKLYDNAQRTDLMFKIYNLNSEYILELQGSFF